MPSTILTNWTVYYSTDIGAGAGMKQIKWTGVGGPETNTNTVIELYSALADLFSNPSQNDADDTIPITAVTPTVFKIGVIDAGDTNPWFIDSESIKHLTGASLETTGWTRTLPGTGTGHTGIVKITRIGTNIVVGDIGATITNSTSADTGVLLHLDGNQLWIRPSSNANGDDWDSASGTITCNGHSDTQNTAGVTGERLWSNIYTIGTLTPNTTLAVVQNYALIPYFWASGHIDRLFLINDDFAGGLIDFGNLSIYARQYGTLYDHFSANLSGGGRNPIPLATFGDTNNTTGYRQMSLTTASDDFAVGEVIEDNSDNTIIAIVTNNTGSAPNITLQYNLIGTDLADFSNSTGNFTGQTSGTTATAVDPIDIGPGLLSGITFTFGATLQDINNGYGERPYDLIIDCNGETLTNIYEYTKYLTRRGSITPINGHQGQIYQAVGSQNLVYNLQTGTFTEGLTVTGANSGATAIIVADHNLYPDGNLILRDVVGTFTTGEVITDTSIGSATTNIPSGIEFIFAIKQASFGTFAGGKFFGARGVYLTNMAVADASNFILTDTDGNEQIPPTYVTLTVQNILVDDRVGMYPAIGDTNDINKHQYTIRELHSAGASYLRVNQTISADTPSAGTIRVVRRDGSGNAIDEQRYTYNDYSNSNQPTYSEFTLSGTIVYDYNTTETAYVPYIDTISTGTFISQPIIYVADRYVTIRVRKKGYLPFITKGQITNFGLIVTAVKTEDTIVD